MKKPAPLDIKPYEYKPVLDRTPNHQTVRERAQFLAHEIMEDVMAPELEIAEAIETEIIRFESDALLRAAEVMHRLRAQIVNNATQKTLLSVIDAYLTQRPVETAGPVDG